jgi:hypothetical protein
MFEDVLLLTSQKNELGNTCCRTDESLCSSHLDEGQKIDNSRIFYVPMNLRSGMTIMCRPEVLTTCPEILECLESDLQSCLTLLPVSVQSLMKRTVIWVNASYVYGTVTCPQIVNHTTTHHSKDWLLWYVKQPNIETIGSTQICHKKMYLIFYFFIKGTRSSR